MSERQKFCICTHCGNLIKIVEDKGAPIICCGEAMTELVANTVEASAEKHLPSVNASDECISVQVGSVPHPMEEEHHISFVYVETERGSQCKRLKPGQVPQLAFSFSDDKPVAVLAYCNLHGMWKTEMQ